MFRLFRITLLVASWACVLLTARPVRAEFVPRVFEARQVPSPPRLDGRLDDAAWDRAQEITEFFAFQSGGAAAAAQTSARVVWDSTHLYVGLQMTDADIRSACALDGQCTRDASLFQGDVIELFIRERTDSTRYHEFEWSPRNDLFDARFDQVRFGAPGTGWNSGMESAVQIDGSLDDPGGADISWTIEAAIPLADFLLGPVDVGTEWTFTVARYDYFNRQGVKDPRLMMSTPGDPDAPNGGVTHGFHSYQLYDTLRFTPVPEPASLLLVSVAIAGLAGVRRRFAREKKGSPHEGAVRK